MEQLAFPTRPTDRTPIQVIKYMGSKRGILNFVVSAIKSVTASGVGIIDLFAGTHSVGYALAHTNPIYANDIQHYSLPIGKALLAPSNELPSVDEVAARLEQRYQQNRAELMSRLRPWLEKENQFLQSTKLDQVTMEKYALFQDEFPFVGNLDRGTDRAAKEAIRDLLLRGKARTGPWSLFTTYFNNAYFSLQQAIDIDSYRCAIDSAFPRDSHLWNVVASCLMHACGYCTPSPGHFAQFRTLTSVAVFQDILRYRNRTVTGYLTDKYIEFRNRFSPAKHSCSVATLPHLEFLDAFTEKSHSPMTVYADPPYSFVHYSRFYHVLETLVRYDYPGCEHFGRYRDDRYQSRFCQNAHALNEFRALVAAVKGKKMNLVLSYANTALVPLDQIKTVCEKQYGKRKVEVVNSAHEHATMGRSDGKSRSVSETVIICQV